MEKEGREMGAGRKVRGRDARDLCENIPEVPHFVLGIPFILLSVIQLNRAFGLKGRVHILLTRIN